MKTFILIAILSFAFISSKANTTLPSTSHSFHKTLNKIHKKTAYQDPETVYANTTETCCDGSTVVTGYYWVTYDSETGEVLASGYYSNGKTCTVSCTYV
ncbi:hypothetical protein [Parafilimonas sp.]|uniref:hypothetical protein n=1 Tax=Parafilimonas sp. TaxID=1969739 RepID=UPI0039E47784